MERAIESKPVRLAGVKLWRGNLLRNRSVMAFRNWRRIGAMVFDDAVISYNGDCVIRFTHPTWRGDRNDPSTATRINGEKVR